MTTILTAERIPFFGGTYFPPRDGTRGSRTGFLTILKDLSGKYVSDRSSLLETAKLISRRMAEAAKPGIPVAIADASAIELTAHALSQRFDQIWGLWASAEISDTGKLRFPTPLFPTNRGYVCIEHGRNNAEKNGAGWSLRPCCRRLSPLFN